MTFTTKDSGERREFGTGSVRDTNAGKPRFDLLPIPALRRWADLMARGAEKYGERNWELGQSMSRFEESALRHLYQYLDGDREEDHLAAVLFNVGGIVHHEAEIAAGRLPAKLDDRRYAEAPARLADWNSFLGFATDGRYRPPTPPESSDTTSLMDAGLLRMLAAGDYIKAIKARRTATGEGLKEAKEYVDGLRAGLIDLDAVRPGYGDSPRSCWECVGDGIGDPHFYRWHDVDDEPPNECGNCGITVEEARLVGHSFR